MAQTCSKCSRANPDDASYCYFDGSVLGDHRANGGPLNTGTQSFPNQFVFPSGKACRNFDQLATAFQENWNEATDLLQQGFVEAFLGGLGRADLALAAREAARFPDRDRGLDQLLAKLPSEVVEPPKLAVEPTEVNLGQLQVGEDREFDLTLTNQGMRLVYGSVTCDDCVWLAVGEAPGAPQKLFQFGTECTIPVHVRGSQLRASNKPVEGRLAVESNAGPLTVIVRAEVPVKPYPTGVLAGASSPRQVAEKAKAAPKDAAPEFEKGAVAEWYKQNGWQYPVQGPPASGLGAVQQFFEALGLTPPPKVEISEKAVALAGNVGDQVRHVLEVKSQEKRPVYAHGTCDQSWLEVGRARLNGRTATIPLVVPSVPNRQGETLEAKVVVTSNGNQQFEVLVKLEVGYSFNFDGGAPAAPPAPAPAKAPEQPAKEVEPVAAPAAAATAAQPAAAAPAVPEPPKERAAPRVPVKWRKPTRKDLVHAAPAGLLALALLGVVFYDLFGPKGGGSPSAPTDPSVYKVPLDDPEPRIAVQFSDNLRFGIVMTQEKDPNNPDKLKKLTSDERGIYNNTCLNIDGRATLLFGLTPGRPYRMPNRKGSMRKLIELEKGRRWKSVWEWPEDKVVVTQLVEIVPGEQTRVLDTCLVEYIIENKDTIAHKVGIRVMLDTYIGANDGVPFLVPGESTLIEDKRQFDQKDMPDFIRAQERPDLKDPGTVALMGLKLQGMEPIEKMMICRWPGNGEVRWEVPFKPMNQPADEKKDSCVVLYWPYVPMDPGDKREMAFTYGLGTVSGTSGKLAVSVHGATRPEGVFTVTAYIKEPTQGQKVKITLPPEFSLPEDEQEEKTITKVEKGKDGQVSWRVRAGGKGSFPITVNSGLATETTKVQINDKSIFD